VLTSLDVCDSLGISGLTLSSDSNCLRISGTVSYLLEWGDYRGERFLAPDRAGSAESPMNGFMAGLDDGGYLIGAGSTNGDKYDWRTKAEAVLRMAATASSDFGPVQAVVQLKSAADWTVRDQGAPELGPDATGTTLDNNENVIIDQAYVSIGDSTVLMAGKKNTIAMKGDDEPFNFLGLVNAYTPRPGIGRGVYFRHYPGQAIPLGGHSIQVVSDLGNGWSAGAGLENLEGQTSYVLVPTGVAEAGTAVGFVSYASETVSGHVTAVAGGILDGIIENWGLHAGITANFNPVRLRAALAADDTGYWNGLVSAETHFDMFTLAASAEATSGDPGLSGDEEYGFGASIGANVGAVMLNAGFKWFDTDIGVSDTEAYQIALQAMTPVTETLRLVGEVGYYGGAASVTDGAMNVVGNSIDDYYVAMELAWALGGGLPGGPGGPPAGGPGPNGPGPQATDGPPPISGLLISTRGELFTSGAFRGTFLAAKSFE
jgi:hypothetical protein